jgi:hypothetical protein
MEASSLVREITDLHKILFSVLKAWLQNKGNLPVEESQYVRTSEQDWIIASGAPPDWSLKTVFIVPLGWRVMPSGTHILIVLSLSLMKNTWLR